MVLCLLADLENASIEFIFTKYLVKNIFQQVFAHELGHSLGMPHDFLKSENDPRLDESGNSCLGVNGIMSYKVS